MGFIEGAGNDFGTTAYNPPEFGPPTPPLPPPPEPEEVSPAPVDGYHQAEMNRFRMMKDLYETKKAARNEQYARESAEEVQQAFNDHPNVRMCPVGDPCGAGEPSAQEAAAAKLVEVTENQSPEVVALIVEYSEPTINQIGFELNRVSGRHDGDYNSDRPEFDDVVNDLSIVANRAAQAENGDDAVAIIAESLRKTMDSDKIGRFDEAFGRAVENGNPELAAEVITQLQAAGRTDQADDIMQNVEDAINEIRNDLTDVFDDAANYNQELGWLISQWQPMMTEGQLTAAIENYKAENPEYVESLERIDELSVSALRVLNEFQDPETNFSGLGHADDVAGALEHLFGDEKVQFAIAQSQAATEELAILIDRYELDPSRNDIINGIISVTGTAVDGDFLTQEIFNKLFDISIDRSLSAATATQIDPATGSVRVDDFGRAENVTAELDRLRGYADRFGFSSPELDDVFNQLDRVARSTTEGQARGRLRTLNNRLDDLAASNPDLFGENSRFARKFESLGLFLGVVGAGSSIQGAISDPQALNIINALVDTSDVAVAGLQTRIAQNLLQNRPWFSRLPLEGAGRTLGGLGLVLDTYSIVSDLRQGNYVEAGFSTAGAAGGALLVFGTTLSATGVGLLLVGGAVLGSYLYGRVKEANRFESGGARAFLEGAGIDPDLANEMINNDDRGRSTAPVFTELAERLDIDANELFDYFQTLSPREAKTLIEAAHGVDPNDEGVFPEELENPYWSLRPNDVNDLIEWMRLNGFEAAPGLQ